MKHVTTFACMFETSLPSNLCDTIMFMEVGISISLFIGESAVCEEPDSRLFRRKVKRLI
jgi:hypothetical protein